MQTYVFSQLSEQTIRTLVQIVQLLKFIVAKHLKEIKNG